MRLKACFVVFDLQMCRALSALPSPLWGGVGGEVGGGGREIEGTIAPPPSPALPHKGGGSRSSMLRVLSPFYRTRFDCPDSALDGMHRRSDASRDYAARYDVKNA